MRRQVRFSPEASSELEDAVRWYEQRHDGLGLSLLAALDDAVALLQNFPEAGEVVPELSGELGVRRVPDTPLSLSRRLPGQ